MGAVGELGTEGGENIVLGALFTLLRTMRAGSGVALCGAPNVLPKKRASIGVGPNKTEMVK